MTKAKWNFIHKSMIKTAVKINIVHSYLRPSALFPPVFLPCYTRLIYLLSLCFGSTLPSHPMVFSFPFSVCRISYSYRPLHTVQIHTWLVQGHHAALTPTPHLPIRPICLSHCVGGFVRKPIVPVCVLFMPLYCMAGLGNLGHWCQHW